MTWTDIQAKWATMAQRVQSGCAASATDSAMMNEPAPSLLPPDLEQIAAQLAGHLPQDGPIDRSRK